MEPDHLTTSILRVIEQAGFTLTIAPESLHALDQETGEHYVVRFSGDLYGAAIALAELVGLELEE